MKHAYMILAHGEPELLQALVQRLDDPRNDIYVHFDKKWLTPPTLTVTAARLILLEERIDVRWADVSMLQAEYALFRAVIASGEDYSHCHLISGVDLPLKSQEAIHAFFAAHAGKEFVGLHQAPMTYRADKALHYWHPFAGSFRGKGFFHQAKRILRYLAVELQILLGRRRNKHVDFRKGGQWVSVTPAFLSYLLSQEQEVYQIYRGTFGADEYFIPTLLETSPFRHALYNDSDESLGAVRSIGWRADGQLIDFGWDDLPGLQSTQNLFARKFNSRDWTFIQAVLELSAPHA